MTSTFITALADEVKVENLVSKASPPALKLRRDNLGATVFAVCWPAEPKPAFAGEGW